MPQILITLANIQLIVIGLLRSKQLFELAADKVKPSHFSEEGYEKPYRVLYELARSHHLKYSAMIDQSSLRSEFERFQESNVGYLTPDQGEVGSKLIDFAWLPDYDLIDENGQWQYVRDRLGEFLIERHATRHLKELAASDEPMTADTLESIQRRFTEAQLSTKEADINPFTSVTDEPMEGKEMSGAAWFDLATNGGVYPFGGETIGFLAGPSWGKTGCAIHLAVAFAKRGFDTLYFSYEQPVRDVKIARSLLNRVVSCATGIPRARIEKGKSALSEGELRRLIAAEQAVGPKLHFYDMSGFNPNAGFGGIAELEPYLSDSAHKGWNVRMVIIDWFGLLVDKYMSQLSGQSLSRFDRRYFTTQTVNRALVLGAKHHTNFFMLHQVSTDAVKRKPGSAPSQADAQDAKNFSQLMQFCLNLTEPNEDGFGRLYVTKARGEKKVDFVIRRDWVIDSIDVCQDMVEATKNKRQFVKRGDEEKVDDEARKALTFKGFD